ncbi:CRISPR-associated helicase Cas3' [Streptomyces sp. 7N604]
MGAERGFLRTYEPEVRRQLGALWGKSASKGGGRSNLLLSHLLDTAAVAECIWDFYLAPSVRRTLDVVAGGRGKGRALFAWVCGVHDCGKATPAFQRMDEPGARAVQEAGLSWDRHLVERYRWRHDKAGGKLIRGLLEGAGWRAEQCEWVWPIVAGHHGFFPSAGDLREPRAARGHLQGRGASWAQVQRAVVEVFSERLGFEGLAAVEPRELPSRTAQLQLSGFVVMADWIASDERFFTGIDDLAQVSIKVARERAAAAWSALGLRGGWGDLDLPSPEAFRDRFGHGPRPSQLMVLDAVGRMGGPGLLVVEAPMGEGKTKAALAAAEVLAARFGADGVYVGMPTQATSDPMFGHVRKWAAGIGDGLESQVALLHGKRMFNREWQELLQEAGESPDDVFCGIAEDEDEYGMSGPFGADAQDVPERRAPAEWFLGRKRGLLSPLAVGTIDQLLFAATRTKHVMLRMAGLSGKVVILDEVHAADVYMSQFLKEGLRWLGQAGVPVVLLSATLPPGQRRELLESYVGGEGKESASGPEIPEPDGYPSVTAVWGTEQGVGHLVEDTQPWRGDLSVGVEVLPELARQQTDEAGSPGDATVARLLEDRLADGGCALVIRNTVARAQATFQTLRAVFGEEVRLLHGRLHAEHRAERTQECLELLGPPREDGPSRPDRLILVATQLAEQSFDVDADLLVTDLAPVDLLLQRIGRVHRHAGVVRPDRLREPQVVVTGFAPVEGRAPWILPASEAIYGRYLLLRTAALVLASEGQHWQVPGVVPQLVAKVYGDAEHLVPEPWREEEAQARAAWQAEQARRARAAEPYLLARRGEQGQTTLEGLHFGGMQNGLDEAAFQAMVRDGEKSTEVVLLSRDERGYRSLGGRWLGVNGEVSTDLVEHVLGTTVRLPTALTEAAEAELRPLDAWQDHPWLRYSRALVLDERHSAQLGGCTVRYDKQLGLVVTRKPTRQ